MTHRAALVHRERTFEGDRRIPAIPFTFLSGRGVPQAPACFDRMRPRPFHLPESDAGAR
jgi:hypothetical protein